MFCEDKVEGPPAGGVLLDRAGCDLDGVEGGSLEDSEGREEGLEVLRDVLGPLPKEEACESEDAGSIIDERGSWDV